MYDILLCMQLLHSWAMRSRNRNIVFSSQAFVYLPFLLISPFHLTLFTYLAYVEVGWPAFIATGFMVLQIPIQVLLARTFAKLRLAVVSARVDRFISMGILSVTNN